MILLEGTITFLSECPSELKSGIFYDVNEADCCCA